MKYNLEDLKKIMPGDWKTSSFYYLDGDTAIRIAHWYSDDKDHTWSENIWFMQTSLNDFCYTNDESKVLAFYKKHFKFLHFK